MTDLRVRCTVLGDHRATVGRQLGDRGQYNGSEYLDLRTVAEATSSLA
jgi:hypothetical protein